MWKKSIRAKVQQLRKWRSHGRGRGTTSNGNRRGCMRERRNIYTDFLLWSMCSECTFYIWNTYRGQKGSLKAMNSAVSCVMTETRKDQGICMSLEERKSLSEDVSHDTFSLHILSKYVISSYLEMCSYSSLEKNATEMVPMVMIPENSVRTVRPHLRIWLQSVLPLDICLSNS